MKITIEQGFQQFLNSQQIDFEALLEEAGIPNLLWKEELQMDESQYFKLQEVLGHHLNDEQILMVSQVENLHLFMPAFFAALAASNGVQALQRFAIYKQLVGPVAIELVETEDSVRVVIVPQSNHYQLTYFSVVNELTLLLSILRTGTGVPVMPIKMTQPFEVGSKVREEWGCMVESSQEVSVTLRLEDLELPFLTRNNTMWQMIRPELERQLQELKSQGAFIQSVHQLLQRLIAAGEATLENLARKLGLSPRTLQRQLKEEQTTFKSELQAVQFHMAIGFAMMKQYSIEDIAYLVGYSEVSAFSRAFKKWSGTSFKHYIDTQRSQSLF